MSNVCFHSFYQLFVVPVKNANVSKMVNILSILLHHFTVNDESHRARSGLRDSCIGRRSWIFRESWETEHALMS